MNSLIESEELMSKLKEPKKRQYKGKPTKAFIRYCNKFEKAYDKAQMWRSVKLD